MSRYKANKAARLKAEAAEAAEIREALEDPNVVALMVERNRKFGEMLNWAAIGILAVFCIVTVHDFVSRDVARYSLEWFGAWFLEPGLISGLIGILIWEGVTSRWGVPSGPWTRTAKWGLLGSTLTMNVWMSVTGQSYGGIVAHTVPPLVIVLLTEARIESLINLAECVRKAHVAAVTRREALIAEQLRLTEEAAQAHEAQRADLLADAKTAAEIEVLRSEANVQTARNAAAAVAARTGPAVFGETSSDRSGEASSTGPRHESGLSPTAGLDRSGRRLQGGPTRRSGPVRKTPSGRSGKKPGPRQRTDDDLLRDVHELVAGNGGEQPTQYQLKQALGIGNDRAARLLAQLDPQPAGDPATNGAAKTGVH